MIRRLLKTQQSILTQTSVVFMWYFTVCCQKDADVAQNEEDNDVTPGERETLTYILYNYT